MSREKNRWLIAAATVTIHLSIGSVYAYSVMTEPVASLLQTSPAAIRIAFSIAIFFLGIGAALLGNWVESIGPRKAGLLTALFYGVGIAGAGLALQLGSLPLFYLFYGVVGGIGLGIGYIAPVAPLLQWFPDRRGMASGLAIMGFGFASLLFAPLMSWLFLWHTPQQQPTHQSVTTAFYLLGALYFLLIAAASLYLAPPPAGWQPPHRASQPATSSNSRAATPSTAHSPHLALLIWLILFLNITSGIALLSSAAPLLRHQFSLTALQAAATVGFIGIFNGLGRLVWASLSDTIGRTRLFILFFAVQMVAFLLLPQIQQLWLFQLLLFLIISCYGGGFSTLPPLLADLYGTHGLSRRLGRILTAWAVAGIAGPTLTTLLYNQTENYATALRLFAPLLALGLFASWQLHRHTTKEP